MKKNRTPPHATRLLGVFAHPDDESFCAGGTFARSVAHGAEVMVVSATRGEAGQIRSAGTATRRTLARVREQELQRGPVSDWESSMPGASTMPTARSKTLTSKC